MSLEDQLRNAVKEGDLGLVIHLVEKETPISVADGSEATPLHYAAKKGILPLVEILVQKGADIEVVDKNGYTALHLAALEGRLAAVRLLVEKGADIKAVTKYGHTPLDIAREEDHLDVVAFLEQELEKRKNVGSKTESAATRYQGRDYVRGGCLCFAKVFSTIVFLCVVWLLFCCL